MIGDCVVEPTFDTRVLPVGPSPWTYASGNTLETLFIEASGRIDCVETQGAKVIPPANASTHSVTLIPGQAVVVHYTGKLKGKSVISRVAPTDENWLAWASFN